MKNLWNWVGKTLIIVGLSLFQVGHLLNHVVALLKNMKTTVKWDGKRYSLIFIQISFVSPVICYHMDSTSWKHAYWIPETELYQ